MSLWFDRTSPTEVLKAVSGITDVEVKLYVYGDFQDMRKVVVTEVENEGSSSPNPTYTSQIQSDTSSTVAKHKH